MTYSHNDDAARIVAARASRPFTSVDDLWRPAGVKAAALTHLAKADGFRPSLGLARREALWAIKALRDGAEVVRDYNRLGLTLRDHPLAFLRRNLRERDIVTCQQALAAKDGKRLTVAGLVLVRQRPGSAEGVVFMTLEDETANMNVIIWPDLFDANRRVVLGGQMLAVKGMLQKEGDVVHLVAKEISDLSILLADVGNRSASGIRCGRVSDDEHIFIKVRNFH